MPKVRFQPQDVTIEVAAGSTLLEAAREAGIALESPCNGAGVCEKCKVRLLAGKTIPQLTSEHACVLPEAERRAGWVLSCHAVVTSDLSVEVPGGEAGRHQILSDGQAHRRPLRPWIHKQFVDSSKKTQVFAGEVLIAEELDDTTGEAFGLAVDIGTTTLVVSLVDLLSGRELGALSAVNPQTVFGHDVLSRIQFAGEGDGLQVLQTRLIEELNRLTAELGQRHGVVREQIYEAVLSGNTTMLHLAVGADPRSLGRYPYTPVIRGGDSLPAAVIGLQIAVNGQVYLPPVFDAYVGADIASGVLATALTQLPGVTLFVDVGTNGEMILADEGQLHATSTAAGPAFEGMNISCGMRAAEGAIEVFQLAETGQVQIRTIGGMSPVGICGSGLIDVVGELVAHGVIDKSGRFTKSRELLLPALSERLITREGKPAFDLGGGVYLSQKDVRQVQLAKGATRAGIDTLLRLGELTPEKVDRVLIAGSFGYHLRPQNLIYLGLLPAAFAGKIEFVGNTSKTGAQAFLLDHVARVEMARVVRDTPTADLAHAPNFEKIFVAALAFPAVEGNRIGSAPAGDDRQSRVQGNRDIAINYKR